MSQVRKSAVHFTPLKIARYDKVLIPCLLLVWCPKQTYNNCTSTLTLLGHIYLSTKHILPLKHQLTQSDQNSYLVTRAASNPVKKKSNRLRPCMHPLLIHLIFEMWLRMVRICSIQALCFVTKPSRITVTLL